MSIFQGGFSVSRFKIIGEHDANMTALDESIRKHRLKPYKLGQTSNKEIQYGWVQAAIPGEGQEDLGDQWSFSDGQIMDGFMLRMRIDKRAVPRPLLQNLYQDAVKKGENASKSGKLSRQDKKQILVDLKDELLAATLPSMSFLDALWQIDAKTLYVFTTGKRNLGYFEDLFRKTFCKSLNMSMVRIMPPLLGLEEQDWAGGSAADEQLGTPDS